MDAPQKIADTPDLNRIVSVRPVNADDLPEEIREQAHGIVELYAVHASNGDRLALVNGRNLAFVLARQNDMVPVNVH